MGYMDKLRMLSDYIREGNINRVKEIILDGEVSINDKDDYGFSPLLFSLRFNQEEIAIWLIDKGSDVNIKSEYDEKTLTWAIYHNNISMIEKIIEAGFDLNVKTETKDGEKYLLPFYLERSNERYRLLVIYTIEKYFHLFDEENKKNFEKVKHNTELFDFITKGSLEGVKEMILDGKVSIEEKDRAGFTPLNHAMKEKKIDIVKWLLEHGADPNAKANGGQTVSMWAFRHGNTEIIEELIKCGLDLNARYETYESTEEDYILEIIVLHWIDDKSKHEMFRLIKNHEDKLLPDNKKRFQKHRLYKLVN